MRVNSFPVTPFNDRTTWGDSVSKSDERQSIPKSIRHKKILDRAAEHPEASLEKLAEGIPSATPDLVEHVLDEYGDPGEDPQPLGTTDNRSVSDSVASDATSSADSDSEQDQSVAPTYPRPVDLSEKERRTLEAIHENPTATQSEIAEQLDVSPPTVSNRVNDLENFEWEQRERYVETVFDEPSVDDIESGPASEVSATDGGPDVSIEQFETRLERIERKLESRQHSGATAAAVFTDTELLHKVVHACMASERITEDEELRILETLLPNPAGEDG